MESIQKPGNQILSPSAGNSTRTNIHRIIMADENISLEPNQIIRGLVTDLRPGEISIRLANKQAVTAHLEGNNEVSIGDVASFKILENKDGEITLFRMNSTVSPEESTILKALEEANLPANTVNIEIVKELLYHQLPINKESINMVLKQAMQYKDAQISTLVYLDKNGIPLEENYIQKFEQCRNFDYRLLDNIKTAQDEFLSFMGQAAHEEPAGNLMNFATKLFDFLDLPKISENNITEAVATDGNPHTEEMLPNTGELASVHANISNDSLLSFTSKEQSQLLELFNNYDMPEEFMQSIENNTVNIRAMVHHITEALTTAASTDPTQIESFKTPVILDIMEQYGNYQQSNNEVASFISTNQRMELLDAMQDFPLSISDAAAIANGEINSADLLALISGYVQPEYEKNVRKLLSSEPFHKLVAHEMTGEFCLTPDALKEEDGVEQYYSKILNKMNQLKEMTADQRVKTNPASFQAKADGVKESFDFMKSFNQLFTYVQLPVKLTNQVTHGDLYVYTNKEKLKAGPEQISVLLHLDMDNLGPLDIHLSLNSSTVQSKFYVQDKETKSLLSRHEEELRTALSKTGFGLNMEIYQQTKEVDILKDLTETDSPITPIKRYSFDIRA